MPDMKQLADTMLASAATVLGRLVEVTANAPSATRNDHEGSIRTDGDELVALTEIPSLGVSFVLRVPSADMQKIVSEMLGGIDDGGEMGAMQLSIISETVSQIAVAMAEALAQHHGASQEGITAALLTDATNVPPPPFESYDGVIDAGAMQPRLSIDFPGVVLARLGADVTAVQSPPHAEKTVASLAAKPAAPAPAAQGVSYTTMRPTQLNQPAPGQASLDLVHDVPLQISAVLGRTVMPLRDVVSLQSGAVFELDKEATEPIDLYVNNILIARGEVVVVDEKYAVKISELNPQLG